MTWLTEEQLIYLHDELIRATGGSQGLRTVFTFADI